MGTKGNPSRAEFERLKTQCDRLRGEVEMLRAEMLRQADELKTQFTRIAQMQAILDEERHVNVTTPPQLHPPFPHS
jgi:predicted  nucleic acid-binding Zn-ribbon protein